MEVERGEDSGREGRIVGRRSREGRIVGSREEWDGGRKRGG